MQLRDTFSLNIIRRQASGSQLACVGADLCDMIGPKIRATLLEARKANLKESGQVADATVLEKDENTLAASVRDVVSAMISGITYRDVKDGTKPVVSGRYIDMARELKTGAIDLFEKVKSGEVILRKAITELKLRDNPPQEGDVDTQVPETVSAQDISELADKAVSEGKVSISRSKLLFIVSQLNHYITKYGYEVPASVAAIASSQVPGIETGSEPNMED